MATKITVVFKSAPQEPLHIHIPDAIHYTEVTNEPAGNILLITVFGHNRDKTEYKINTQEILYVISKYGEPELGTY